MLKVGDYIQQRNRNRWGIVKQVDKPLYFIDWKEEDGKKVNAWGWYSEQIVEAMPVKLSEQDIKSLIDLALDTRDFKWVQELVEKINFSVY